MLWKDISFIDMIIANPSFAGFIGGMIIAVIALVWISPKSGTGPG